MSPVSLTRRALVQGSAAALGAAALPAGIAVALAAETAPAAVPLLFDPAAFLADLNAAGYGVTVCRNVPRPGEACRPPSYFVTTPKGQEFGDAFSAVMARWSEAMDACPNHVERVVAYVFGRDRDPLLVREAEKGFP